MRSWKLLLPLLASSLCFAAQPDRITGPIDSSQMITLPGHIDRRALPQYDQGPVEPTFQFGRVTLVMAPSPSQQIALNLLLAQQQDRSSPNYHKWLTPEQFAERFGVSQGDINKITAWLESQGFQAISVPRGRTSVSFSGTAAQVQTAFKTEIHRYEVNGENHIANSTPVEVPAALSGVITGVRGLTDSHPRPMYVRPAGGGKAGPHPSYTTTIGGNTEYVLAPGDIATIYDINSPGIDGTGQKLAIIGETDIYLDDIADFRTDFGLNQITDCSTDANGIVTATACNTTNFQYVLVPGVGDLGAPSTCGDLPEADLDIEWSGATAQNAQIIFVNAPATFTSDCTQITNNGGTNVALAYAIDNVTAPVISMSYGLCEAEAVSLETELQQGNAEGITIMNSAGDSGAAACDGGPPNNATSPPFSPAIGGLAVNYPASSPEVTGVGGTSIPVTDFSGTYWNSNGVGTVNFGASALTTLEGQEVSWNDDVAIAQLCEGDPSNLFCTQGGTKKVTGWVDLTSAATAQQDIWISIGGGGVSNCLGETGGGICTNGFPKPTWQNAITIPGLTSTYRFVPDVSLLASPNYPGYIFCTPLDQWVSGSTSTASTCSGGISTAVDTYSSLVGGTSASSPVFAGIVALLNQYLGSAGLGNINPTLYSLAATPGNGAFHAVTSGVNDVYCAPGSPSGQPADVICPNPAGVFGFSASSADTKTSYNLVTGLGSVDADKLFAAWSASRTTTSSITITPSATNVTIGTSVSFAVAVTPTTGVGAVSFSTLNNGTTTVLGTATLNAPYPSTTTGTATFATTELPGGSNSVTATYEGDASDKASTSAPAVVTVTVPFSMSASTLNPSSVPAGQTATSTIKITPTSGFTGTVSFTNSTASNSGSCTANLPPGALCSFSPGSVTLNGSASQNVTLSITTTANMALPSGTQTITVTGTSGSTAIPVTVNLTVAPTNQSFTLSSTNGITFPVTVGGPATVDLAVAGAGSPISFVTSSVTALPLTYTCTGVPSLPTAEISCELPNNGQPTTATGVTVILQTTPATSQLRLPFGGSRIFYALLLPGLFGIVLAAGSRTRGLRLLSLILVLGFSTLWLGACGSSGGNNTPKNPGTPPGTYALTIKATTGGANPVTYTLTGITLNVSP
jgi:subtilase family serine protease